MERPDLVDKMNDAFKERMRAAITGEETIEGLTKISMEVLQTAPEDFTKHKNQRKKQEYRTDATFQMILKKEELKADN
eukprot:8016301-Karenia_brevis.AAC.1